MNKSLLIAILIGCFLGLGPAAADDPAPADKGVILDDAGQQPTDQTEGEAEKQPAPVENPPGEDTTPEAALRKQVADLEAQITALKATLQKMGDAQKEVELLKGKITIVEGENTSLAGRIKTLEEENSTLASRVKRLEGDNASLLERTEQFAAKLNGIDETGKTQVTAAKPGFVKSAVRFHNHEGRPLRMNVNGVWHTLQEGQNDIWVPYGPVHIYRYNGSEPRAFFDWKPYKDGYVMEFDVGKPTAE